MSKVFKNLFVEDNLGYSGFLIGFEMDGIFVLNNIIYHENSLILRVINQKRFDLKGIAGIRGKYMYKSVMHVNV